ncbi:hypothetical protein DL96DRAFT_1625097 [Flagelloscypha sp. PMI_526]|nr:hypothetical protein DL96DRAFT_1625097 [Flagelloscypha sp. PMI_526]
MVQAPLPSLPTKVRILYVLGAYPRNEGQPLISDAVSSAQITHLYMPRYYSLYDFCNLTHLWVETQHAFPADVALVSYLFSLPPVKSLPTSVKICILHSLSKISLNPVPLPQLMDLIMGDIDPRIVLAVAEPKRARGDAGLNDKWILKNTVIFWEIFRFPNGDVWEEARKVMMKRRDPGFRERVGKLD